MTKKKVVKIAKAKAPKAKRSTAAATQLPELVAVMAKVAERLGALETKVEALLHLADPAVRHDESAPAPPVSRFVEAPNIAHQEKPFTPQASSRKQGRHERPLYDAVCADCQKPCQVPFKVTGERPVYCKECFAKRKENRPPAQKNSPQVPQPFEKRLISVTPNGVGKVTISEMVVAASSSGKPPAANPQRPRRPSRKPR